MNEKESLTTTPNKTPKIPKTPRTSNKTQKEENLIIKKKRGRKSKKYKFEDDTTIYSSGNLKIII